MKLYKFERLQNLPIDLQTAWDFFSSPQNLSRITPKKMGFQILYSIDKEMFAGQIIAYTIKPILGIPITWVTEITHFEQPNFFIDEQRFGPYKFWHHQHKFRKTDSGIEMTDIVHYAIPFGFLGRIINFFIVRKQLEAIFNYRTKKLSEIFN